MSATGPDPAPMSKGPIRRAQVDEYVEVINPQDSHCGGTFKVKSVEPSGGYWLYAPTTGPFKGRRVKPFFVKEEDVKRIEQVQLPLDPRPKGLPEEISDWREMFSPEREHPATSIFPLMDELTFEGLKDDIRQNGLKQPVEWFRDPDSRAWVIDGRNRLRACVALGKQPTFQEVEVKAPLDYVVSANLHRRHLTAEVRAIIAAEALPRLEAEAKKRQVQGGKEKVPQKNVEPLEAASVAAKLFATNADYVRRAKRLKEENPEQFALVKAGKARLPSLPKPMKERHHAPVSEKYMDLRIEMALNEFDALAKYSDAELRRMTPEAANSVASKAEVASDTLTRLREAADVVLGKVDDPDDEDATGGRLLPPGPTAAPPPEMATKPPGALPAQQGTDSGSEPRASEGEEDLTDRELDELLGQMGLKEPPEGSDREG